MRRGRVPRGGDPAGGTGPAGNPGPWLVADPDVTSGTGLILFPQAGALPAVWAGPLPGGGLEPGDAAALLRAARPGPLLPQHGEGWFGRPGLSGHRLDPGGHPAAGRDWSPRFQPVRWEPGERRTVIEAEDSIAGLRLVTEADAVPGGAIRVRHTVTNTGRQPYVVDRPGTGLHRPGHPGAAGPRGPRHSLRGALTSAARTPDPAIAYRAPASTIAAAISAWADRHGLR
jgi:Glycosyl hydrolase family 36 N-terminal domain